MGQQKIRILSHPSHGLGEVGSPIEAVHSIKEEMQRVDETFGDVGSLVDRDQITLLMLIPFNVIRNINGRLAVCHLQGIKYLLVGIRFLLACYRGP